jgi:UDPglucose 6-dehydrogenase
MGNGQKNRRTLLKVAVIGAGFVGEATGRGFAKHKNEVTFVDIDSQKVTALRNGGLDAQLAAEYTSITTDVTMFCVPTPTVAKHIKLNILEEAVMDFALRLKTHSKYHVAVIRSTVPPHTTRDRLLPIIEKVSGKKAGKDFGLVMQPEYLREVTAQSDFERPWFVLIGEFDKKSGEVIEKLYKPFNAPIEHCSLEEAEVQKYIHNVYNAVKIAFFNEMRIAMNRKRWNADKIFRATAESCEGLWNPMYGLRDYGPFDGSCLPKDTRALLEWGEENGFDFGILRSVIQENVKHEQQLGKNKKVTVHHLAKVEA